MLRNNLFQKDDDRWLMSSVWHGSVLRWFFTISNVDKTLSQETDSIVTVSLELDPKYDHYHRIRFSIQNWLIAVAGISRAIMLFGLYLTKYLSRYIYRLNIIETLFMRRTTLEHISKNAASTKL